MFKELIVLTLTTSLAYAHSVPTHSNLTAAAVAYLKQNDPRFACTADLNKLLQTGTIAEDDDTWEPVARGNGDLRSYPAIRMEMNMEGFTLDLACTVGTSQSQMD